ncbi:MAG: Na+/H+ antiporter subunit C [Rhizobium sp.]|nr:Na+/H+ antiporter subunit C [Rhizobium sp.]
MEALFSGLVGIFFAAALYLMMSKHIVRVLLGIVILGNAVNLLLFTTGRLTREVPPIIAAGSDTLSAGAANPLPQALILTAIVISFSFFCFLLVLTYRAYQDLGTDDTDEMRVAEPKGEPLPPMGY